MSSEMRMTPTYLLLARAAERRGEWILAAVFRAWARGGL